MTSSDDRDRNVSVAGELVARAAEAGALLVVLPEKWNVIAEDRRQPESAEALDGPSLTAAKDWARRHRVAILAGSVAERIEDERRVHNTSVLIREDGSLGAVYRKLHLFDVDVGGHAYRESSGTIAGSEIVVADVLGRRLGLSVCYDVRFPELYRRLALAGAQIIAVPAAFTATTGKDHWEPLLRARAIETQAYVIAAAQFGMHATGRSSHGRSMIIDPWGVVLAQAPDGETVIVADLDFDHLTSVRERLPALRHQRIDVYGP